MQHIIKSSRPQRIIKTVLIIYALTFFNNCPLQAQNFAWAKSMGGAIDDWGNTIAVNPVNGDVYTSGFFHGTVDFNPGQGIFNLTSSGFADCFISKLDAFGNFVWAIQIGGSGTSAAEGKSIAVNPLNGDVFLTGGFGGAVDFDPGTGTFNLTANNDIFISRFDASGNFIWAKQMLGGGNQDVGLSISLDAINGCIYTTGYFEGTADFDPGAGTFNLNSAGGYEVFISKLDVSGNFIWAKQMGGTSFEYGYAIATDTVSKNIYLTGLFSDTADFDPGAGFFNLTSAGGYDIFISKLDSSGNFIWAKSIGGVGQDNVKSIAVFSPNGDVYITGGNITKLDSSGNFVWAKQLGGSGSAGCNSIAIDPSSSDIYTTGSFGGIVDFDPGAGTFNLNCQTGSSDVFVSKLDSSGGFLWAVQMGGVDFDMGFSIALNATSGDVYTVGHYQGIADYDPGPGIFNLNATGNYDIFISKLSTTVSLTNDIEGPQSFTIYPNPFSPSLLMGISGSITISFSLKQTENVSVKIYDVTHRLMAILAHGRMQQGTHQLQWNAKDENGNTVNAGLYLLQFDEGGFSKVYKLLFIK